MKKAVVIFINCHGLGVNYQAARQACEIALPARAAGFDCYVVADTKEEYPGRVDQFKSIIGDKYWIPLESVETLRTRLTELILRYDQTVFSVGGYQDLSIIIPLRKKYCDSIKILLTVHSYRHTSWWKRKIASLIFTCYYLMYVDYVNFLSPQSTRCFWGSSFVIARNRGGVIPWGTDVVSVDDLQNSPNESFPSDFPSVLRESLSERQRFRFVLSAYFKNGKGHAFLLESFVPVARSCPDVQLIMIGNGEKLAEIQKNVKELQLENQVILPGWLNRNHLPAVLRRCHVGIVPSYAETFGHSTIEMMAAGLPVIATPVGVAEQIVSDYITGFSVPYNNHKSMTHALTYCAKNHEAVARMGSNARNLVQTFFSQKNVADAYVMLFSNLLRKRKY